MWKFVLASLLTLVSTGLHATEDQTPQKPIINLESLKETNWSEQEMANVAVITDFVQNLMNNHDFDYILERYNNSSYIQHNRNLPDKITGLVGFLEDFVADYPDYSYEVKHVYADGDFVIFHSHATLSKDDRGNDQKGMNIIDVWRLEDGNIVEHWDSIQAIDGFMRFYSLISGGNIRNSNGVF